MKILVPTDFSGCADYALDAACKIAEKTSSEIYLFHVAHIPKELMGLSNNSALIEDVRESINNNVKELLIQRLKIIEDRGLKAHSDFEYGKLLPSVIDYDRRHGFDLIVMGSYGASGKQEWFIGSNTQKLVRKMDKNILVIKEPLEDLNFEKLMFPSNLILEDKDAFRFFLKFAKLFNAKEVHILAVNTSGYFNQPATMMLELLDDFKALVNELDCKTHFASDYSVEAGIRHFSDEYKINLIGISNLVRSPIKRIFQGSNVEMLVNHSDLPVLVIGKV